MGLASNALLKTIFLFANFSYYGPMCEQSITNHTFYPKTRLEVYDYSDGVRYCNETVYARSISNGLLYIDWIEFSNTKTLPNCFCHQIETKYKSGGGFHSLKILLFDVNEKNWLFAEFNSVWLPLTISIIYHNERFITYVCNQLFDDVLKLIVDFFNFVFVSIPRFIIDTFKFIVDLVIVSIPRFIIDVFKFIIELPRDFIEASRIIVDIFILLYDIIVDGMLVILQFVRNDPFIQLISPISSIEFVINFLYFFLFT